MRPYGHPSEMSPEQRRRELARILAAGVLRLRKRRLFSESPEKPSSESSAESAAGGLDVPAKTVLSGRC